jgi:membrane-associated phospholipid phosphatase
MLAPRTRLIEQTATASRLRAAPFEFGLMASLFALYYVTRGVAAGRAYDAFVHAFEVMHLEQQLGLFHELAIQSWVLGAPAVVRFLNFVYAYTHLTAVVLFGTWVFLRHFHFYPWVRATFLAILGVGLLSYIVFPLAPPRFFGWRGFVDTLALYHGVNYDHPGIATLYNPFAAMPSLHAAFALFSGIGVIWIGRRWYHWALGVTHPSLMALAVVSTGNHYILDVIAGFALAAVAWVAVPRLLRQRDDTLDSVFASTAVSR